MKTVLIQDFKKYLGNAVTKAEKVWEKTKSFGLKLHPQPETDVYCAGTAKKIQKIKKAIPIETRDTGDLIFDVAETVKSIFDRVYGEGKYVFVAPGRSFASTAKALEHMGVETKTFPISGLSYLYKSDTTGYLKNVKDFEKYKKYLYDIGLNPEAVNNSGKKYIFCDFASSGNSLRAVKDLMLDEAIGLSPKNTEFIKLNKVIGNFSRAKQDSFPYSNRLHSFDYLLTNERFDEFSHVRSLNFDDIGKIDRVADLPLNQKAKDLDSYFAIKMTEKKGANEESEKLLDAYKEILAQTLKIYTV